MKAYIIANGNPCDSRNPLYGIFELDQAKSLASNGVDVVLLSVDLRSFLKRRKFGLSIGAIENVKTINFSFPLLLAPIFFKKIIGYFLFKKIYKIAKERFGYPDILHAHFSILAGYYAYKINKQENIPYVVTEHSSLVFTDKLSKNERKTCKLIFTNSNLNIGVSRALCDTLSLRYGKPFRYVPNIVDLSNFKYLEKERTKTIYQFVSVGNLKKSKGFDILLSAVAILKSKERQFHLNIIGEGEFRASLESIILNNDLNDYVTLLGKKERKYISEIFSKSDCFVLPSRVETFGVVYIEALASGLPVIASKCGGPTSFLNDKNSILVDVDSVTQLTEAMENMINHKVTFDSFELAKFASNEFSSSNISSQMIELYNGVLLK